MFAPVAMLHGQLKRLDVETPFQSQGDLPDWRKIGAMAWWRLRNN